MKKLFFALVLIVMHEHSFSQKITVDKIDDFTGAHIVETSYAKISDGFNCTLRKIDGRCYFSTAYNCGDEIYSAKEGAEFMLKLNDGEIIILNNLEYAVADYWSSGAPAYLSHFVLKTEYLLSPSQVAQLQSTEISVVRLYTSEGYIERIVSERNAKRLLKLFNLIKML
ncbi:hypothetical protein [Alistipes sp.]|uniref:hypothetical protein n=1 Tax=Alistipes sp. TaxID=1872444 RepID=UPI00352912AC